VKKFRRRHPDLIPTLDAVLTQLAEDPDEPTLRLHPLIGKLNGHHSVSVTHKYRTVFVLQRFAGHIRLVNIGSHDDVYGKAQS